MSRYAVCDSTTNIVQTVIIAKPGDPAYDNTYLFPLTEDQICNAGWVCDGVTVYDPNPPPEEP